MNKTISILIKKLGKNLAIFTCWGFLSDDEKREFTFEELKGFSKSTFWEAFSLDFEKEFLALFIEKMESFEEGKWIITFFSSSAAPHKKKILNFLLKKAKTKEEFGFVFVNAPPNSPQAKKAWSGLKKLLKTFEDAQDAHDSYCSKNPSLKEDLWPYFINKVSTLPQFKFIWKEFSSNILKRQQILDAFTKKSKDFNFNECLDFLQEITGSREEDGVFQTVFGKVTNFGNAYILFRKCSNDFQKKKVFNLLLKKLQTLEDVALLLELPLDEYQIKRVVTASKRLIKTFEDAKWCHESLPPRFQKVFLPIMIRKAVTFKDLKWFLEEKIDLKRHQRERVLKLIFEKPKTFEECHWLLMKKIFKGLRKQKIFRLAFNSAKTFADAKLLWDVNNSYYHDKKWEEEILVLLEIEAKSSQEWQWFFGILSPIDRKRPKIWFLLARRKEKSSEDIKWLKKTEIFYHSNEHRPRIWSYYKAEVKDFNDCTYLLDLDCLSPGQKKEVYILLAKKTENASHCQWISNNVNPKHINNDLKEKIFTIMTKD